MAVERKNYKVILEVVSSHVYEVEARGVDQAVSEAEQMLLEDGDVGVLESQEVLDSDVFLAGEVE
jgi:hypothetical protein